MIAEYQNKSNIGVGIGFLVEIAGRVITSQGAASQAHPIGNSSLLVVGGIVAVAGAALFIWGCVQYCLGKGYSGWTGLLGLLSCIGLLVLVVLPDKNKNGGLGTGLGGYGSAAPPHPGTWPPPPQANPTSSGQPLSPPNPEPPRKTLSGDDL